jgi:lambda family phage portal protein
MKIPFLSNLFPNYKKISNYWQSLYYKSLGNRFAGPKSLSLENRYVSLRGLEYEELQERAYIAIWDSIQGRGIVKQLRALTVNNGLKLQAIPERFILNITPQESQEWSTKTESNFKMWRTLKESDYEEKNNFRQLEALAELSMLIFGEFFVILRYSTDKNRVNPLQIQIIPPWQVKQPTFDFIEKAKNRGNKIKDGIELDKRNREIAIYVYNEDEKNPEKKYTRIPVKGPKTKKTFVLHGFIPEDPGQVRGVPFLSPIIHELSKITDLELAELDSAAANATLALAITRDQAVVNNQKLNKMGEPGWDADTLETAEAIAAGEKPARFEERLIKRGGFSLQNLEPGEGVDQLNSSRPNLNIPAMIDKIMEYAGPAIGIPIEVIKMLFGQNYSASKGALDLAWRNFQFIISNFSSDFEQEIYKAWMEGEIAAGRIIAPGFNDVVLQAAWLNANWSGLPIPSLNPFVETKAAESRAKNGFSNREFEAQNLTGTSFDNNVERLKTENKNLVDANESLLELNTKF